MPQIIISGDELQQRINDAARAEERGSAVCSVVNQNGIVLGRSVNAIGIPTPPHRRSSSWIPRRRLCAPAILWKKRNRRLTKAIEALCSSPIQMEICWALSSAWAIKESPAANSSCRSRKSGRHEIG
jgi:hypothetical protein